MINWRVRIKSFKFWVQIAASIVAPIMAYFGLTSADITTWPFIYETLIKAASNPYVCFTVAVSVVNTIIDPTTVGIKDSPLAMTYAKPGARK